MALVARQHSDGPTVPGHSWPPTFAPHSLLPRGLPGNIFLVNVYIFGDSWFICGQSIPGETHGTQPISRRPKSWWEAPRPGSRLSRLGSEFRGTRVGTKKVLWQKPGRGSISPTKEGWVTPGRQGWRAAPQAQPGLESVWVESLWSQGLAPAHRENRKARAEEHQASRGGKGEGRAACQPQVRGQCLDLPGSTATRVECRQGLWSGSCSASGTHHFSHRANALSLS